MSHFLHLKPVAGKQTRKEFMSSTGNVPQCKTMFKKPLIFLPKVVPVRKVVCRQDVDALERERNVGQDASA